MSRKLLDRCFRLQWREIWAVGLDEIPCDLHGEVSAVTEIPDIISSQEVIEVPATAP
jgi:hypothetical protein